jgi:ABC-type glycerol-3-phosphate transport system substrate-binding protein
MLSVPLIPSRREFLRLCSATAAGAALAACVRTPTGITAVPSPSPSPAQPIELVVAADSNVLDEGLLRQFNADYSPLYLTRLDASLENVRLAAAAGRPLDVFCLEALQAPYAVRQGWCLGLDDYFDASKILHTENLYPANDLFIIENKRYGALLAWSPDYSVWINQDLWKQAGVDLPQSYGQGFSIARWRELSAALTRREGSQVQVIGTDFEPASRFLLWAAAALEPVGSLFQEDGVKLVIKDNPALFEAVRSIEEWKKEGGLPVHGAEVLMSSRPTVQADFDCT